MLKVVINVDLTKYFIETVNAYNILLDINLENILSAVSYEVKIPIKDIKSKCSIKEIVDARKLYYYLSREYTKNSFAKIGKLVGKNHATVLFGFKKAESFLENEINFRNTYESIKERLDIS